MADAPKILIVDDEPRMTDSIKAVLSGCGYDIDTLNVSTDAVARLESSSYEVALLDVMMPGLTGFQLLDALDRDKVQTLFIIMTGDASVESAIEAVRRGASDYIRKPVAADELVVRVDNVLKQKVLRDERRQIEAEKLTLEKQLRQSQKMEAIGTLAGGIAHDFNNILGIILGNAELARDDIPESHRARTNLDKILTASNRAKAMINQLLSFTRKTDSERKPLELRTIITESLKLLRSSLPTNIVIRHDIPDASFMVRGDATQIHQIMINLCTNASHAMEATGGVLEVRLRDVEVHGACSCDSNLKPGSYIKLTVVDNGHGIDPTVRDRIFDPYFTTKEPGKGTGMGLAVVHGIVKNHGGEIEVFSQPDVRTEFRVLLPIVDAKVAPPEPVTSDALPTGKERVLLVDDEEMIVDTLKQMLKQLGYEVEAQTDSYAALDTFRRDPERYDLVITDMTMPNLTGDRLAEQMRRIRPTLPVILCSGFNERIDRESARTLGIQEFLMKPLGMHQLAGCIRKALDEPLVDRRKDKRFLAKGGAFVISQSVPSKRCSLLDISLSGLAFKYDMGDEPIDSADGLFISTEDSACIVDDLAYTTVFDIESNGKTGPLPASLRKRGIRFDALTANQEDQLGYFIQNHTAGVSH